MEVSTVSTENNYMVPVQNNGKPRDSSLTPITIMVVDTISFKKSRVLLKVLLDPGSTKTLVICKASPIGTGLIPLQEVKMVKTLAGAMKAAEIVHFSI